MSESENKFALPEPPYPALQRGLDVMIAAAIQRGEHIKTRENIASAPNPHGRAGKLTAAERQEIAEIGYTLSAPEIAEKYGVSPRTIQNVRSAAGLKPPKERGVPKKVRKKIAAIGYRESAETIARRYGITTRTVRKIRAEFGLDPPNTRKPIA